MRGRKPIPTGLKLLVGNPGKRRMVHTADMHMGPNLVDKEPPDDVTGKAADAWRWACAQLDRIGMLHKADPALMRAYCFAYDRMYGGRDAGEPRVENAAATCMKGLAAEMGLTIAAQARMGTPAEPEADGLDDFLNKRQG